MVAWDAEVEVKGPLFDERGQEAVTVFCQRLENAVAEEGVTVVRGLLGEVLRHPTGYYASKVMWASKGFFSEVIGDSVVYGAWLEGVGSRNSPVTRFAGYFTFRRATTVLAGRVSEIAQSSGALPQLMRDLEG